MKNLGKLVVLGAVLAASASFAHADGITGELNFSSTPSADMEYSTTTPIVLTFGGGNGSIGVPITGTFAAAGMSGLISNSALFNVSPLNLGSLPVGAIFTAVSNGTTVTFTATSDSVAFVGPFLDVTFYGTISETGYSNTAGMLALETNSLIPNHFSSYSGTITATPTPEPSSLILLGTGLVSAAGVLVRKRRIV